MWSSCSEKSDFRPRTKDGSVKKKLQWRISTFGWKRERLSCERSQLPGSHQWRTDCESHKNISSANAETTREREGESVLVAEGWEWLCEICKKMSNWRRWRVSLEKILFRLITLGRKNKTKLNFTPAHPRVGNDAEAERQIISTYLGPVHYCDLLGRRFK